MTGASIVARLGLDTQRARSDLVSFRRSVRSAGRSMGNMFKSLASPMTALVGAGGLTLLTRQAMDLADQIDNSRQRAGLSAEAMQRWRYAAEQSGSSGSDLERAFFRLNQRIAENEDRFTEYGIVVRNTDGTHKTSAEVMSQIADRMREMGSQQERTQMGYDLMGRAARDLMPLLLQGSEAIEKLGSQATVMSDETVAALVQAQSEWGTFINFLTVKTAEGISGIRDLWKAMRGEGINDDHQQALDLRRRAIEELQKEGAIEIDPSTAQPILPSDGRPHYMQGDRRGGAEELVEQRMNELTRERLEEQRRLNEEAEKEAEVQAEKTAELERQTEEIRRQKEAEEERRKVVEAGEKVAQIFREAEAQAAFDRMNDLEKIAELERRAAEARARAEDEGLDENDRTAAARDAVRAERERDRLRQRMEEEARRGMGEGEDEAPRETYRDNWTGKEHDLDDLRAQAEADPEGRTVAGRRARDLLWRAEREGRANDLDEQTDDKPLETVFGDVMQRTEGKLDDLIREVREL